MIEIPDTQAERDNLITSLLSEVARVREYEHKVNQKKIVPWLIEQKVPLHYRMGNTIYPALDPQQRNELVKLMRDGEAFSYHMSCHLAPHVTLHYDDGVFTITCTVYDTSKKLVVKVAQCLLDLGLHITLQPYIEANQQRIDADNKQLDNVKDAQVYLTNLYSGVGESVNLEND